MPASDTIPELARTAYGERARSLHRVAVHEYAHYHVARTFGIAGHVEIVPRAGVAQADAREAFSGCFVAVMPLIACYAAQVIALAGVGADVRLAGTALPSAAALCAQIACGERTLSATDARQAGAFGETHVAEALARVAAAWDDILRDAAVHAEALERLWRTPAR